MTQFPRAGENEVKSVDQGNYPCRSPPFVREGARFVTVFTTYLDASRDEGDSNVHMLAGFISEPDKWAEFDTEWQGVLNKFEIPSFHMTDFESGYGVFKDWERDDPRRVPLLRALLAVIDRNTVGSVAYGVSQSMFNSVVSPEVIRVVGGSPYFFLFLNLLLGAEDLMDRAAKSSVEVPYDWQMIYMLARGDQGAGKVANTWMSKREGAISTRLAARMEGVFIATDNTKYLALQAADLLAFEGRKQVGLQLEQHERGSRLSLAALEESPRPRSWHFYQYAHHLKANAEVIERLVLGDHSGKEPL